MSISEKLTAIADNRPKLYNKGASDFGTPFDVTGTDLVTIEHVHPKEHDVEVTLSSTNILLEEKYVSNKIGGITCDYEGNGIFHIYGEHTTESYMTFSMGEVTYISVPIKADSYYTLYAKVIEGNTNLRITPFINTSVEAIAASTNWLQVSVEPDTSIDTVLHATKKGNAATPNASYANKFRFYAALSAGQTFSVDIRIQVWLVEGTYDANSQYSPHVDVLTDVESVTACGKNLFDISKDTLSAAYHVGLTMTVNDDGSFNLIGTLTRNYAYVKPEGISIWTGYAIPTGTTVVLSSHFESDVATDCIGIVIRREIGNNGAIEIQGNSLTNGATIKHTLANEGKTVGYCFRFPDRAVGDYVEIRNIKLQCEIDNTSTEWEVFKGGTYPVTDGKAIVKSVSPTMNILAPTSGASIEAKGYLDGQAVIDELTQAIVDLGGEI